MFFLIILIFISEVNALGISPARKIVDFEPGLEDEIELKIVNTENKEMKVVIYLEGKDANLVNLKNYKLEFSEGEESKTIRYSYSLPDKFDIPGDHDIKIVVREIPKDYDTLDTLVGATVSVVHQFKIKVPYPGKYVVSDLSIIETGRTDQIDFRIIASNFGNQKIVNAKGIINIQSLTDDKVFTINTKLDSIGSQDKKEFQATWNGPIELGRYYAELTLTYDGKVSYAELIFEVGEKNLEVIDITVKNFRLGEIAKFNILVDNRWSEEINDAFVELIILDLSEEIDRFKSASENIPPLSVMELTAFWDSAGVEEGEYNFKIILNYEGKKIEKIVKTVISLNSIKFDFFGTGAVVANGPGMDTSKIVIIVLIIINIGWFIYFRKRKKR